MPYLLFLKKRQHLKLLSATDDRWRFKGQTDNPLRSSLKAACFGMKFSQTVSHITSTVSYESKKDGKYQETIQSSTKT